MNPRHLKFIARVVAFIMLLVLLAGLTPATIRPVYAAPGDLMRISVASSGEQASGRSYGGQISGNGRYVAFASDARNLIVGDTNNVEDVFVKDRQTGATIRVSLASGTGAQANGDSGGTLAISSDGRYVAFESSATNLVVTDTNGESDIFVRDLQAGITTLMSVDSSGVQANYYSDNVSISADGRMIAFHSEATNLVSGDTNNLGDIFVRDRQTGQTRRVSVDSMGFEANGGSNAADISDDGRYVAFSSGATNLVAGDTNGKRDIFVYDLQTGSTTRVSINTSGEQADGGGSSPSISGDGRYVVFLSDSGNLDPRANDYRGKDLVYLYDHQIGQTTLASVASDGSILTVGLFDQPTISRNGRLAAFPFYDKGDNNGIMNIWVRDFQTGASIKAEGGNSSSSGPSLSADGSIVSFSSSASNLVSGDTNGATDVFVREIIYGPERNPTVASVTPECGFSTPVCSYPTHASVSFIVIFSEPVTGVSVDDFSLDMHEGITGASITGVSGSGVEYFVTVDTGAGDGRLRLRVVDNDSIMDTALNPLGGVGTANGDFTGKMYQIDKNNPTVANIVRTDPNPTTAETVSFTVSFSELVYPVRPGDFVLSTTGNISGATITAIDPREDQYTPGTTYTVTINTGVGDGTLRLDLIDDDSILDNLSNPLGGTGVGNGNFTTGETYTINKSAPIIPSVTGSLRANFNPTSAASVNFTVNFSETVSGVDPSDFFLTTTGNFSGVLLTNVSGSGNTYTVTVGTGSGDGDLRLNVVDDDSILNASGSPLGGLGAGNGNFISGEAYTIDKTIPFVISSLRTDANPTNADSVHFNVTFSEAVSGVDAGDFILTTTDRVVGVSITNLNDSANTYTVTVATGSGNGTLRLDLIDHDSIMDSANNPLGGLGVGNGSFSMGEAYVINKFISEDFRSTGSNDGWVLESSENSNKGGSRNSSANVIKLGDDSKNRQFRSILHFPTYYLPDNAVVTQVILMIKQQNVVGTDPFTTHQNISIDIRKGFFSNFNIGFWSLQLTDFQAPADMLAVGLIQNNPVGGWYWAMLDRTAFPYINLTSSTQLRLGFQLDDNNDHGNDYINFFSGDYQEQKDRPHLLIEYYIQK